MEPIDHGCHRNSITCCIMFNRKKKETRGLLKFSSATNRSPIAETHYCSTTAQYVLVLIQLMIRVLVLRLLKINFPYCTLLKKKCISMMHSWVLFSDPKRQLLSPAPVEFMRVTNSPPDVSPCLKASSKVLKQETGSCSTVLHRHHPLASRRKPAKRPRITRFR